MEGLLSEVAEADVSTGKKNKLDQLADTGDFSGIPTENKILNYGFF